MNVDFMTSAACRLIPQLATFERTLLFDVKCHIQRCPTSLLDEKLRSLSSMAPPSETVLAGEAMVTYKQMPSSKWATGYP